jgi:hypothetical protein
LSEASQPIGSPTSQGGQGGGGSSFTVRSYAKFKFPTRDASPATPGLFNYFVSEYSGVKSREDVPKTMNRQSLTKS